MGATMSVEAFGPQVQPPNLAPTFSTSVLNLTTTYPQEGMLVTRNRSCGWVEMDKRYQSSMLIRRRGLCLRSGRFCRP